ncbi:MAG: methionyl-tRNA formyltransferase [Patescibacteria group bacterium]
MMSHKFIYFGTPNVARDTLARLLAAGFTPALVVTAPDAPRGRGLVLTPSPTRVLAEEHGIPTITPEVLDAETLATIRAVGASYALCIAYGKIFPESLIQSFPLGVLNVHYSLLPKYRGATPLEAALLAGDQETGVTIQKMVKALDAGDVIAQRATPIGANETARELRPRLITLGADLLIETLPHYLAGEITPVAQDETQVSRSGKFQKEDGLLDLAGDARENWNKYRAYTDSIGTYFFKDDKRMKITVASFMGGQFIVDRVIPEGKKETAYR